MIFPLLPTVLAGAARAAPMILPPPAVQTVARLASTLPDGANGFGFECRLGGGGDVDFGVSITTKGGGRQALARFEPSMAAVDTTLGVSAWRRVSQFAKAWAEPGSALHTEVPLVFLELDAAQASQAIPTPAVFVRSGGDGAVGSDASTAFRAAETALSLLAEVPPSETTRRALAACVDRLHTSQPAFDVGVMSGREHAGARFYTTLPASDIARYLVEVGWPGRLELVDRVVEDLFCSPREIGFQLDLSDGVLPTVGLEVSHEPEEEGAWAALLDRLTERELALPEERDALRNWPGVSRERLPGCPWPCDLHRMLSHVKVSLGPGRRPAAKVYLWCVPRLPLFG